MINKKLIIIMGMIFLVLPLVLAANPTTQNPRPALDMYYLFVEQVFGNVIFAGVGIAALLAFICMMSRASNLSLIYIVGLWCVVFGMWLLGGIVAIPAFLGIVFYYYKALGIGG